MATITMPPVVDARGNLSLHSQEGCRLAITGDVGETLSTKATAGQLRFQTASGLDVALIVDPDMTGGALLVLTKAQVDGIPATGTPFALTDSSYSPPVARWEGTFTRRGWPA